MTKHWTPLAVVYLVIGVAGLLTTGSANVLTVVQGRSYFGDIAAGWACGTCGSTSPCPR